MLLREGYIHSLGDLQQAKMTLLCLCTPDGQENNEREGKAWLPLTGKL